NAEGKDIAAKIKNLPKVTLILANGSTYDQEGKIETINSQVSVNTGSISFRAVFDNPSRLLTNGNSGKIRESKSYENVIVVQQELTYEQELSTYVYNTVAESTAVATRIIVTAEVGNMFVGSEGLKAGDKIVAKGVARERGD